MSRRFFVDYPISGDSATLVGPEAHHLAHVCRAKPGEEVTLFDGSGAEFAARVERVGRAEIELAVLNRAVVDRELSLACTIGVALPKGDRQTWLVEKAVELGVSRIVPLSTERGVAQPVDKALDRLRRAVIEASKQCGRNRLLDISEPLDWPNYVAAAPSETCRLIAHPSGAHSPQRLMCGQTSFYFAVGPEGGFTDDEVAISVQAGWHPVVLGPRILRVETAAICLASLVANLA